MPVYRYRQRIDVAKLQSLVPGSPTFTAASPLFVDVTVAAGSKPDLDEAMAKDGFVFESQDPVTTPSQQAGGEFGSSFDIRDVLVFDHFISGNLDTDEIGLMGWRTGVAGTGADLTLTGEAGHPGILDFGCGTVAGGRAGVFLGETTGALLHMLLSTTQGQLDIEWLVRFNANALSSVNLERFVVGLGDNLDIAAGSEQANGIYCEFDPLASANFQLTTASASTRTKTVTSIAVAASTWYRIGLRITYPGGTPTAELLINGVVRATNTLNFPTVLLAPGVRGEANVTAAEARYQVDYVRITQVTAKET